MRQVISISRRTDIPAFYTHWLIKVLEKREVRYVPPRGGLRIVSLDPKDVHSLVFWSKNYGPLIKNLNLLRLLSRYNLYFHFTITGLGGTFIEPKIPTPLNVLEQMENMVHLFGSDRINWRFDPILHWEKNNKLYSNLSEFKYLASKITKTGIHSCTFSLAQRYKKIISRFKRKKLTFINPSEQEEELMLSQLSVIASKVGLSLSWCAGKDVSHLGISKGHCIDGTKLSRLRRDNEIAPLAKDPTQRNQCGCTLSIDIGSYSQPCQGGCLYCYARPI